MLKHKFISACNSGWHTFDVDLCWMVKKVLKQSQNIRWNYHIASSKLHPANWTHLGILQTLAKTNVIWMKC